MKKDLLMTLLERSWKGELRLGQLQEELGAHVAKLAGQIQDVNAYYASVEERIGVDPNLAPPGYEYILLDLIDTFRELTVRPLIAERDVCTDRLITDNALRVSREDPSLAAALLSLAS